MKIFVKNRILLPLSAALLLPILAGCAGNGRAGDLTTATTTETALVTTTETSAVTTAEATTDSSPETTIPEIEPGTTLPETTPSDTTAPETTAPETTAPETTAPPPADPPLYVDGEYRYRINIAPYLSYISPQAPEDYLILASRTHPLPDGYVPPDLVYIDSTRQLRLAASYAWQAMQAEMSAAGALDTWAQSTYRSAELQAALYRMYLEQERENHPTYTEEQLIALVDTYSARPGTSDHQTGLTIDFYPIADTFENTAAFPFLLENAYKFGFILRYPEGKSAITGYMYEPWHWRFVGREAATEIHERNLTLEEYLDERYGNVILPEETTSAPEQTTPNETTTESPEQTTPDETTTESPEQTTPDETTTESPEQTMPYETTTESPDQTTVDETTTEVPDQTTADETTSLSDMPDQTTAPEAP